MTDFFFPHETSEMLKKIKILMFTCSQILLYNTSEDPFDLCLDAHQRIFLFLCKFQLKTEGQTEKVVHPSDSSAKGSAKKTKGSSSDPEAKEKKTKLKSRNHVEPLTFIGKNAFYTVSSLK